MPKMHRAGIDSQGLQTVLDSTGLQLHTIANGPVDGVRHSGRKHMLQLWLNMGKES